ncbi:MAG: glycosyltransferase [Patescibacteria group bacterium]
MSKKVLIFSMAYYPKFVGGGEVAIKEITDRLGKDDYEFHLISLRFDKNIPKEEKIGNVFVYRIGFAGTMKESADSVRFPLHYNKYLYPFLAVWKALQLSHQHNFKFTLSLMANYSGFGALFFKFLRPEIPFLLNLQEGDPFEHYKKRVGVLLPLFKMIFKRADKVVVLSKYLAKWANDMGFKGEPMVVPNGVDIKQFELRDMNYELNKRKEIRTRLGLKDSNVALITTSRLVIKNGVGDVIEALSKLSDDLKNRVKFVILGEGYLLEKLELKIKNLKLEDRVIFRGFVPHSDMPQYLKACDVFIRPALSEGFGNSFIEAMACRLPVIATPVGGILDFLIDPTKLDHEERQSGVEIQTGYFCEPNNPESIAETIKKVINDPNKNTVVENAYKMVKEKYDWDMVASQMREVFDSI